MAHLKLYARPLASYSLARARRVVSDLIAEKISPEAQLEHDENGAPFLTGIPSPPTISISHSRCVAVLQVALDPCQHGVDVEEWREKIRNVAPRFLGKDEKAYRTDMQLLLAWTAKEAVYKAAFIPGLGLKEIVLPEAPPLPPCHYTASARGCIYDVVSIMKDGTMVTQAVKQ